MANEKIFILDDDADLADILTEFLRDENYTVEFAIEPQAGLKQISKIMPNLILLDIRMKGLNGLEVCKRLKSNVKTKSIPIIFMSTKSEISDVVLGLELGADDYMRKPIIKEELLARVKATLRRNDTQNQDNLIKVGPLELDNSNFIATINGKRIDLRAKEFELLAYLLTREGQLVTRSALSEGVWKQQFVRSSRTIEDHIYRLRKKLEPHHHWIQSIKGVGYRFEVEE